MRQDHSKLAPVLCDWIPKDRDVIAAAIYKVMRRTARINRQQIYDKAQISMRDMILFGSHISTGWEVEMSEWRNAPGQIKDRRPVTKEIAEYARQRFMRKIEKRDNGCWDWIGPVLPSGYGVFSLGVNMRSVYAHRVSYVLFRGDFDLGMDLDHLCRNRKCVNPSHLEVVDRKTNLLRGSTIVAEAAAKTHCISGHELTPDNVYMYLQRGRFYTRRCNQCRIERNRRWYAKKCARNN